MVLTDDVLDAATSAAYGWINQAVPSHALDAHVTDIARHTAALPDCVIAATEQALPVEDIRGAAARERRMAYQVGLPAVQQLMPSGLANGAQTRAGERDLENIMRKISTT